MPSFGTREIDGSLAAKSREVTFLFSIPFFGSCGTLLFEIKSKSELKEITNWEWQIRLVRLFPGVWSRFVKWGRDSQFLASASSATDILPHLLQLVNEVEALFTSVSQAAMREKSRNGRSVRIGNQVSSLNE